MAWIENVQRFRERHGHHGAPEPRLRVGAVIVSAALLLVGLLALLGGIYAIRQGALAAFGGSAAAAVTAADFLTALTAFVLLIASVAAPMAASLVLVTEVKRREAIRRMPAESPWQVPYAGPLYGGVTVVSPGSAKITWK